MRLRQTLAIAVVTAAVGSVIVPALAHHRDSVGSAPDQSMDMGRTGHGTTGRGMTHGGMMRGGMMSGGCSGMMQSMSGGNVRPNSQWRTHPPSRETPD
jgi:hypothetical protein